MRTKLFNALTVFILFLLPNVNFGQAPDLGAASGFALFTASGAFTNVGATSVIGDVGTNLGAFTAFPPGTVVGQIHVVDGTSALAATAVDAAYSYLFAKTCDAVIGTTLEGQVLTSGVSCTGAASTLNGNITLDGEGDPDALFIIKIGGALSVAASSNVILINSASLCNVYWQIGGQFDLGAGSVFRGTVVVDGAISLFAGSSLLGRGLSRTGAIALDNNVVTLLSLPATAGTITGTAVVCQEQTNVDYSVPTIANATDYIWTLPAGATINLGDHTSTIKVNFSATAASGVITVQGSNSCGTGTVSPDFAVTVNPLPITSAVYHY
jgi:hypothetical protein